MVVRTKMKIVGAEAFKKKLDALPESVFAHIQLEMAKWADIVVEAMRAWVPVSADGSHGNPAGTLKDSIGWSWGGAGPRGSVTLATATSTGRGKGLRLVIYAGSEAAFYARWQEFGTVNHRASPYFYVNFRMRKTEAKNKIATAVRQAARNVIKAGRPPKARKSRAKPK